MRVLKNLKTKELIVLEPGQDYREILDGLPDPGDWEYVCEERTLLETELQDSDTGLTERQRRAEVDAADEKRLTMDQRPIKRSPKTPGLYKK